MHLADLDEALVTNRIWTEPQHIEARLTDLTEQMENVIQKYLRNDFATIAEYNEFAGEVAEAFRILVVANFPVNFTEAARPPADEHRRQRAAVRSVYADDCRHKAAAAAADRSERHSAEQHQSGLGRRASWLERAGAWRISAGVDQPPVEDRSRKSCNRSANMPRTRGASKCLSSTSRPPDQAGGPSTAPTASTCRWAARRHEAPASEAGQGTSQHV